MILKCALTLKLKEIQLEGNFRTNFIHFCSFNFLILKELNEQKKNPQKAEVMEAKERKRKTEEFPPHTEQKRQQKNFFLLFLSLESSRAGKEIENYLFFSSACDCKAPFSIH